MTITLSHLKIIIEKSGFGHPAYADFYSYRPGQSMEFPSLIFIGGAINRETYEARAKTQPDNLVAHFQAGCEANDVTSAGFLAVPCPYGALDRRSGRIDDMIALLVGGFPRELRQDRMKVRSLVGNSMGAFFVTGVLPQFPHARCLVTIAGAGMVDAISCSRAWGVQDTFCYSNTADPLRDHTLRFVEWLVSQGMLCQHDSRSGAHAFADYEGNRAVRDAFLKATKALQGQEPEEPEERPPWRLGETGNEDRSGRPHAPLDQ